MRPLTLERTDPLRDEGLVYSKLLKEHGVDVTYVCYKGMPHPGEHPSAHSDVHAG